MGERLREGMEGVGKMWANVEVGDRWGEVIERMMEVSAEDE